MAENVAFTDRAINELQRRGGKPTDDAFNGVLVDYLMRAGRMFIGPGDIWWVTRPDKTTETITFMVPIDGQQS